MTFDIEAAWTVNLLCNYDCEYCFSRSSTEHPLVGRFSAEEFLDFFDSTGKIWLLHISGGEPFFHPDFVHLCRTIASRHYISLNSNFSSGRVREFAAEIDPSRVQSLHCGVHWEERDRRKAWPALAANLQPLVERGFPLYASLVMTPATFAEFPRVERFFRALGVPLLPKAIRGAYQGRWYPQAYTEDERAQFRRFADRAELAAGAGSRLPNRRDAAVDPLLDRDYLEGFPDFTGVQCSAGRNYVSILYDGTILRCGQKTVLGNIFERRLDLYPEDRPCDDRTCPYWCLKHARVNGEIVAGLPRREVPGSFEHALVRIHGVGRELGNRIAALTQPQRP